MLFLLTQILIRQWISGAVIRYRYILDSVSGKTKIDIKVREQLVVTKDMDVHEHERLSDITLRHRLK